MNSLQFPPTRPSRGACTIFLSLIFAGYCFGADPAIRVAAQSGGALKSIGRGVSINDSGDIAFMGATEQGHNVFCLNGGTGQPLALMNSVFVLPATGEDPTQTFGEYVEVNNQREVLAQRRINAIVQVGGIFGSILTAPLTYIERWPCHGKRSVPGSIGLPNSLFAMGDGGAGSAWSVTTFLNPVTGRIYPSPFDQAGGFAAVMPNTGFNNLGQVVCSAFINNEWRMITRPGGFTGPTNSNGNAQPQLADNGNFAVRSSGRDSTIYWFSYDFTTFEPVANSSKGFGDKGLPGVDDGGTVMVFCAELTPDGAAQIDATLPDLAPIGAGPGIFYSAIVEGTRIFRRLAGISGNGVVDPGETWTDENSNGQVDVGEDQGIVGSFDYESRACVNRLATSFRPDRDGVVEFGGADYLSVFSGTDHEGRPAIFSVEFGEAVGGSTKAPSVFLRQGDPIEGLNGQVAELNLHDGVNNAGAIACWARTSSGSTAILTGPARPVTHLSVLTHGFGNPSKLKLPYGIETPPIGIGEYLIFSSEDFLGGWYQLETQIAGLPKQYGSVAKQAELEGKVVSYVSNWPSTDGWFQAITSVLAIRFFPQNTAQLLTYAGNEMDRAALLAEGAAEKIVLDLSNTGFLSQEILPEIHLIGHSRGAAVNSRVARLLFERGITPAQYTALDGYSTDWPALSGILGDLSIVDETAGIPGMPRINVLVDDGFDEVVVRAILNAEQAFAGYIASWLGRPAPIYADSAVEDLKQFTLGWKAPVRSGFDNYLLKGCEAQAHNDFPGIAFTNHVNVTAAYTFCDRSPGERALMDSPLGRDILSIPPIPVFSPRSPPTEPGGSVPLGVKDGDFDALGELAAATVGIEVPEGVDPVFETFMLAMQRPEFILASSWDITGNVNLSPLGDGYAARLEQGADTSMFQMVKFGDLAGSIEFDLGIVNAGTGATLEVYADDERLGSIDLSTAQSSHHSISLFGVPDKVTNIGFRLPGAGGAEAAVVTIDNVEITDTDGTGYPSLQAAYDESSGIVTLTLTGAPGRAFRIQASSDLKTWTDIAEPMDFSGSEIFHATPPSVSTARYYRVAW